MVFGYSTNAFVRYSVFHAVEKIAYLGFRGVEIMCDRPHLYPPDFGEDNLIQIKKLIHEQKLKVTNLNSFTLFAVGDTYLPSWIEPDAKRRQIRVEHTSACLRLASFLGCKNISVPPGGPLHDMSRNEAISLFYKGLEQVIPLAEELDVNILIEPEPGLLVENTKEFKTFIQEVASHAVGLNFDIGHFFCAGENPSDAFEELFHWIGHVHVEDIASSRIHNHLIPGHGAIQFLDVFETMNRMGYNGDISLELYPYVDMPVEAGRESLSYLLPIFYKANLEIEGNR